MSDTPELQKAWETIKRLEEKYADDPNMKRMPHLHFGIGDSVKKELDEKYGITYVKKRLELEEQLGITHGSPPSASASESKQEEEEK